MNFLTKTIMIAILLKLGVGVAFVLYLMRKDSNTITMKIEKA